MLTRFLHLILPAALLVLSASAIAEPITTGYIGGMVRDAQGAPIMGATVTLASADSVMPMIMYTDAAGNFEVTSMALGTYSVKVEFNGLPPVEIRDSSVQIGTPVMLGVTLDSRFPGVLQASPAIPDC